MNSYKLQLFILLIAGCLFSAIQKEKLNLEYHGEGLPCAFLLNKGKQTYFISNDEINSINDLNELILLIDKKLSNIK
tara:strand:- start:16 stop:246 length:231 start_codon:yes stop_codon:yes gene_type:complete